MLYRVLRRFHDIAYPLCAAILNIDVLQTGDIRLYQIITADADDHDYDPIQNMEHRGCTIAPSDASEHLVILLGEPICALQ